MARAIIEAERRMPYPPKDLAALVSDVRSYPSFIPWMRSLTVVSETCENGVREMVARAEVGWKAIHERFTSKVRATETSVDVGLVDGPFRHLENTWRFEPDGKGGSVIHFRVVYEFKNIFLQKLVSVNRSIASDRIMKAFETEARRRYAR
ncbi:MAG: type II toxin-antitoxin system RatA family toxin [Alphaproteobacteria bacterium]